MKSPLLFFAHYDTCSNPSGLVLGGLVLIAMLWPIVDKGFGFRM
jgi:hypothetical protein